LKFNAIFLKLDESFGASAFSVVEDIQFILILKKWENSINIFFQIPRIGVNIRLDNMEHIEKIHQHLISSKYSLGKDDILNDTLIHLEREINENLVVIDLEKESIKLQFNLNENYYFENINDIFFSFFNGAYMIKYYCNNESLLYSKFIWKNKELRKFNFKTKYGFLRCKKINKIEQVQGIAW
jgi:hypothetical protein